MNVNSNRSLNLKLRNKRKTYNLTIEEVSSKIGVDVRTYRRWEQGEQKPHFRSLKQLCILFDSSAEDLGYDVQL